jgi:hypothetical protein
VRCCGRGDRGADLVRSRVSKAESRLPGSVTGRSAARDSGGLGWRRAGSAPRVAGRNSGDLL